MRQFLVDANVFVAAIKNPGKKTRTLDLILELISNQGIKSSRFHTENLPLKLVSKIFPSKTIIRY